MEEASSPNLLPENLVHIAYEMIEGAFAIKSHRLPLAPHVADAVVTVTHWAVNERIDTRLPYSEWLEKHTKLDFEGDDLVNLEKYRFDQLRHLVTMMGVTRQWRSALLPLWRPLLQQVLSMNLRDLFFHRLGKVWSQLKPRFGELKLDPMAYYATCLSGLIKVAMAKRTINAEKVGHGDKRTLSSRSWFVIYPSMKLRRGSELPVLLKGQQLVRVPGGANWLDKSADELRQHIDYTLRVKEAKAWCEKLLGKFFYS